MAKYFFYSISMSQFERLFHGNLKKRISKFNYDNHGIKEIFIFYSTAEKRGKI